MASPFASWSLSAGVYFPPHRLLLFPIVCTDCFRLLVVASCLGLPRPLSAPAGSGNPASLHRSGTTMSTVSAVSDLSERRLLNRLLHARTCRQRPAEPLRHLAPRCGRPQSLWSRLRSSQRRGPRPRADSCRSFPRCPPSPPSRKHQITTPSPPHLHSHTRARATGRPRPSAASRETLSQLRPNKLVRQHKVRARSPIAGGGGGRRGASTSTSRPSRVPQMGPADRATALTRQQPPPRLPPAP